MAYPPWVMKYKKKGLYVNKVNESTYRLYRGHSERVAGTNKVKRIVDEYIGTITESEGLKIRPAKVKGEVRVLHYGGYALLSWYCRRHIGGLFSQKEKIPIAVVAMLLLLYGKADELSYQGDWICTIHPNIEFPLTDSDQREAERVSRGLHSTLEKALQEDTNQMIRCSKQIYKVWVNGSWVEPIIPRTCSELATKHQFRWV